MPTFREFALPDLGEGLTEGEILQWLVTPGETVRLNQPVVEVETAKAAVEIPSPYAGVVTELAFAAGTTVDVGSVIIRFDIDPDGVAERPSADDLVPAKATRPPKEPAREAVLVGYGVRQGTAVRRARRPVVSEVLPPSRVSAAEVAHAAEAHLAPVAGEAVPTLAVLPTPDVSPPRVHVLAKPPVRKLARDLGVDLTAVPPTGPGGTVSRADVLAHAESSPTGMPGAAAEPAARPAGIPVAGETSAAPGPSRAERRIPVKGVRRAMAQAMVASAFTAPHATLFTTVDVTPSIELIARLRTLPAFEGGSVGPLLLVARALLLACRRHPEMNASFDDAASEIVVHGGVGLGIAAATPRGLLVPVVPDADLLSLPELSLAIARLTATARAGRTSPAELSGGTISITNVGSFGMDNGTPIINPGEGAILCLGAVRQEPWVHEGALAIRHITRLSLSLDHRFIDGALGAAFLADIATVLAEPAHLLAWG